MISEIQFKINAPFTNEEYFNFTQIMKESFNILPEKYTHEVSGDSLNLKNSLVVRLTKNKEFFIKTKENSTSDFKIIEEKDSEKEESIATLNDTTGFVLRLNKEKQYSINIPIQNTSFLFRTALLVAQYVSPEKVTIFQMNNKETNELFTALSIRNFISKLETDKVEHSFSAYQ